MHKTAVRKKSQGTPALKKLPDIDSGKIFYILFLLLAGLYFGLAGWTRLYYEALAEQAKIAQLIVDCNDPSVGVIYEGIPYCTNEDYFAAQQSKSMEDMHLYWIFFLPDPVHVLLSAFAFGLIGSLIKMVKTEIVKKSLPDFYKISLLAFMGGITAVMLLGASYLFPSIFSDTKIILKPILQPFLSLFAGVYSEHIQKWFQLVINKFFHIEKEKTNVPNNQS